MATMATLQGRSMALLALLVCLFASTVTGQLPTPVTPVVNPDGSFEIGVTDPSNAGRKYPCQRLSSL